MTINNNIYNYLIIAIFFVHIYIIYNKVNEQKNNKINRKIKKMLKITDDTKNKMDSMMKNIENLNIEIENNNKIDINKRKLIIKKLKKNNIKKKILYQYINKAYITNRYFDVLIKYINTKPYKIIENFLTEKECDDLINLSKNKYVRSRIGSNRNMLDDNVRTSKTVYYNKKNSNNLICDIEKKIINLLDININQLENIQVTKYEKNQYYKIHHDYIIDEINQRKYSIIIYLNDLLPEDGGETHFPMFNEKIIPKKGRLLYFDNFIEKYENTLTAHESKDILTDKKKYILVTWSRLYNFRINI
jgi:prolyl 4-hydroxylase